ncbi:MULTISPECIES: hypothetical protein [Brenneria]|uniref:DUF2644 domain-containing protein n=1 Tax=Brenneria nigrifluens DSM 30175 = ATCC 13028 TaxID=1121120 RepID=A0A2U1USN0_9GAMM|nr:MULTISPECIES: hypothetical protein [Brenneria]EHD21537.1 hypothetical protein BrE312_2154 [Brenneria sp. EniD312]PWC24677.1 hypothetical protein DDT54_08290 [Brenneria nigrifluens DSM 30175 = ATCC 13028]QCR04658.1 hypothetical protein EH206_11035 [Brenneria nigrifluens DSM 30175 = ATCC 13028]
MSLRDLITNPASGRLSTSDTLVVAAFVATTVVLLWYAWTGQLTEWLFVGYIAAWVTQSQASKYNSIKRDSLTQQQKEQTDDSAP